MFSSRPQRVNLEVENAPSWPVLHSCKKQSNAFVTMLQDKDQEGLGHIIAEFSIPQVAISEQFLFLNGFLFEILLALELNLRR